MIVFFGDLQVSLLAFFLQAAFWSLLSFSTSLPISSFSLPSSALQPP